LILWCFDRWKLTFYSVPKIALIPYYHRVSQTELFDFIFPTIVDNRCQSFVNNDDHVFYLFLQKQKIALSHIPFGYSPIVDKTFYIICFGFVKFAKFVVSQVVMLDGEEGK
jgi:hypothetical protein